MLIFRIIIMDATEILLTISIINPNIYFKLKTKIICKLNLSIRLVQKWLSELERCLDCPKLFCDLNGHTFIFIYVLGYF